MNRPGESYLETSATALFADALARAARLGIVSAAPSDRAAAMALSAVKGKIIPVEGLATVSGTSIGTSPSGFETYADIPVGDDVNYGVGAVLMALCSAR